MENKGVIIAIDGPSGAGKGTIASYISKTYGFYHLDSGLLYRQIALEVIKRVINPNHEQNIQAILEKISFIHEAKQAFRLESVAAVASKIALYPFIRHFINSYMRCFVEKNINNYPGFVIDGRDIGTNVFKNAPLKFFITADEKARSLRRQKEENASSDMVSTIKERDERDEKRSISPLYCSSDAYVIDTTFLSLEEMYEKVDDYINFFTRGQATLRFNTGLTIKNS